MMPNTLLFEGLRNLSNWPLQRLSNPYLEPYPRLSDITVLEKYSVDTPPSYLLNYLFTTGSGSTAIDSSGNGYNGTISNWTWNADIPYPSYPSGYSMNASSNGQITVSGGIPFDGSFSVAFWMYPTQWAGGDSNGIISQIGLGAGVVIYDDGDSGYNSVRINARLIDTDGNQADYLLSNSEVALNTWQFWVFTWDVVNGIANWYLNGIQDEQYTGLSIGSLTNSEDFLVGFSQPWSGYFQGEIGYVGIFSGVLSQENVTALYNWNLP